ncbi:MAG TPA: alkaline phosphatase family protein [Mycobacteriales bacterium]|nr:alkaline phosphatase family protein [Mycobacteriales bacterium]
MLRSRIAAAVGVLAVGLTAVSVTTLVTVVDGAVRPSVAAAAGVPRPDHVVIAIFENHKYGSVINNPNAPYITSLASQGANFTQSFAITHPSQPNYLALYSGSTQGITNDSCPHTFSGGNLGQQLIVAGDTFTGYSESMPSDGYTGCISGRYARKHNPWVNFTNVPAASNVRFSTFPTNFASLPTLSFVVPNLCNDMHDCSVKTGDTWARNHLDSYVQWAKTHNSLLILTFDEDDSSGNNLIPTVFVGQGVTPGNYGEHIDHYTVLRTLEDMYGLAALGSAASRTAITDIWA